MRKFSLRRISTRELVFVWYETRPEEPYLAAFRRFGDPDWELVEEDTPYDEHLQWTWTQRKQAYPPIEELADAMVHFYQGDQVIMNEYLSKINEIKTRYPLPDPRGGDLPVEQSSWARFVTLMRSLLGLG